jgi:hypothetical protein
MALEKCFERVRSGARDAAAAGAEVLRDSIRTGLAGRREDVLEDDLEPFREPLDETALAGFAFKLMDLWPRDERPAAFLGAFGLVFAFVAIVAATYTVNCGLKSRRPVANDLLFQYSPATLRLGIPTAAGKPSSGDIRDSISMT